MNIDSDTCIFRSRYDSGLMTVLTRELRLKKYINKLFKSLSHHPDVVHYGREIYNSKGVYIQLKHARSRVNVEDWASQVSSEFTLKQTRQFMNIVYYCIIEKESVASDLYDE